MSPENATTINDSPIEVMDSVPSPATAQERVYRSLRQRIQEGVYPVESRMPTAQDLASEFNLSTFTVHRAMETLANQGLLERRRKAGTVVLRQDVALRTIGMFNTGDQLTDPSAAVSRLVGEHLKMRLTARKADIRFWYESYDNACAGPHPSLMKAIAANEIQAVVFPAFDFGWAMRLECPTALVTSVPVPNRVDFDRGDFAEQALGALAEQGCRRVGLITSLIAWNEAMGDNHRASDRVFFPVLERTVDRLGLELRPEWRRTMPVAIEELGGHRLYGPQTHNFERFGYEAFRAMHAAGPLPEGLMVFPDVVARGVAAAMGELGVRPPGDMKVVFHRNEGIGLGMSFPYTALDARPGEIADAMLLQIDRQLAGRPLSPILLKHYRAEVGAFE